MSLVTADLDTSTGKAAACFGLGLCLLQSGDSNHGHTEKWPVESLFTRRVGVHQHYENSCVINEKKLPGYQ